MLTLTERAGTVVKAIVDQQPDGTDAAGLRISLQDENAGNLSVTVAPAAQPGDTVVESDGGTVFVSDDASEVLADKVLDAEVDQQGNVEFQLGAQS